MHGQQKDFSLGSGERQIGKTLSEIRFDHLCRYQLAAALMQRYHYPRKKVIFDIFCGNGYGTSVLSKAFPEAVCLGVDGSKEAIAFAEDHFSSANTLFLSKISPFFIPTKIADIVISLESLEHVSEDRYFFQSLLESLQSEGMAIISVPNENVNSLSKNPHKFHCKHYTKCDINALLPFGFEIILEYGQDVYLFREDGVCTFDLLPEDKMVPKLNHEGQVSIYLIKRK
jgi:SAM-dependent methyltransferase